MILEPNTKMLLFRYSNYKKYSFIDEHISILQDKGHVWMLKLGRRINPEKVHEIAENGGWMVLRMPKADGGSSYLAKFIDMQEKPPKDDCYPEYYKEFLENKDEEFLYYGDSQKQWFKITFCQPISSSEASSLVVSKNMKSVDDVVKTTRTAVMFIQNDSQIEINGVD